MKLNLQKRLAASVLKVGTSRVWLDPEKAEEISKAITKTDIKSLIKKGIIKAKPKLGVSKGRARLLRIQRQKGRRRGQGSRKGTLNARLSSKKTWINKVRALRGTLAAYKHQLDSKFYRELYNKIKGNFFRNVSHLKLYLDKNIKK